MRLSLLAVLALAAALSACGERAGITYHAYTPPSGEPHYSLHLADYKRGLFFGSCGPSTLSLQWEYRLDLAGAGPVYDAKDIALEGGDLKKIPVESGTITLGADRRSATLSLAVGARGRSRPFPRNGSYPLTPER